MALTKKSINGIYAAAALAGVLAIEVVRLFHEGWAFCFYPHNYLATAMNVHLGAQKIVPINLVSFFGDLMNDNPVYSPLYRIGSLTARIGEHSPPWFRMAGLVFLALIFLSLYRGRTDFSSPIDRLTAALLVVTTPVVFQMAGQMDDAVLHFLFLAAGAVILQKRLHDPAFPAWPFALFFGADLLFTHMVTNSFLAMISLAGMGAWSAATSLRRTPDRKQWAAEAAWIALATLVLLTCAYLRLEGDEGDFLKNAAQVFGYYGAEASHDTGLSLPFTERFFAYPRAVLFSTAGIVVCALAALNVLKRFRGKIAVPIALILPPALVLTLLPKKQMNYVWNISLGLSLLAAEAVPQLPKKWKYALIVFCFASPLLPGLDRFVDKTPFVVGMRDLECRQEDSNGIVPAKEVQRNLSACGRMDDRPILLAGRPYDAVSLGFSLSALLGKPVLNYLSAPMWLGTRGQPDAILIKMPKTPQPPQRLPEGLRWSEDSLPVAYSSSDIEIRCHRL